MIYWLSNILMGIGAFCSLVGTLGLLRLPNIYNRLHANTITVVGGCFSVLVGAALRVGWNVFTFKIILILVFIYLTNAVASHAVARSGHKSGHELIQQARYDDLKEEEAI